MSEWAYISYIQNAVDATVKILFDFHIVCFRIFFRPTFLNSNESWTALCTIQLGIYPCVKQSPNTLSKLLSHWSHHNTNSTHVNDYLHKICEVKMENSFEIGSEKIAKMSNRKRTRSPLNREENDDDDFDFDENCSMSKSPDVMNQTIN